MTNAFKEEGIWHHAKPDDQAPKGVWWDVFHDEKLNEFEKQLETGNFELVQAVERYDQATDYYKEQASFLYPDLGAIYGSGYGSGQSLESINSPLSRPGYPKMNGSQSFGLASQWELDFWGQIRSAVASAKASAEASQADVENARLSLQSILAAAYMQLRRDDSLIILLTESIAAYQIELDMMQHRHDEGIASGLDVARSQTLLEQTKAQKYQALSDRSVQEHGIALLLGLNPAQFSIEPGALVPAYPQIPATVPSDVLQRRPDIAAAERRVEAANDEIGIAKAAFYPQISLGMVAGIMNTQSGGLLAAPDRFWSMGPLAFLNIFDAGLRKAVVDQAESKTREVTAAYRQTVLNGFREVEDNLARLHYLSDVDQHESLAVKAAEHTFDLADNLYREGAANYLDVVDAEIAKLSTERTELDVQQARLVATVGLIESIGGVW
jgi:NodT family efflux transporter outer membrane factor (OMF) lipoprotein